MSRYTVTIVSNGGDWLLGRWYWTVSGPLANQDDDPDALFAFDLARGFAHSEKGARRKVGCRLARLRRGRAAHLNRIVIEEPA